MMTNKSAVITEYEDILLGHRENFSKYYFSFGNYQNQNTALDIFRYAFEKLLKWRPEEVRDSITMELLSKMKLDLILGYIRFPSELNRDTDLYYIAHLMYPTKIKYTTRDLVLTCYHRLLNKDINRYPKSFFSGEQGMLYASICLQDVIFNKITYNTIEDLYALFSDTSNVMKILKKNYIDHPCKVLFGTPLDYLHMSLPEKNRDELLYNFYHFQNLFKSGGANRRAIPN